MLQDVNYFCKGYFLDAARYLNLTLRLKFQSLNILSVRLSAIYGFTSVTSGTLYYKLLK